MPQIRGKTASGWGIFSDEVYTATADYSMFIYFFMFEMG